MRKQVKLTPEQQAAQNAEYAKRALEVKAEKEAAAQKRRADAKAHHDALDLMARTLKANAKLSSSEVEYIGYDIGSEWLHVDEELREWVNTFAARPANSFEWSSNPMERAAEREILDGILWDLIKGRPLAETVRYHAKEITRRFLENYDRPSSTSAAHNAMMIAKREVQSRYVREDGVFARWLKALDKAESKAFAPATEAAMI